MHPREIIEALGVRVRLAPTCPGEIISFPPGFNAAAAWDSEGAFVWVKCDTLDTWFYAVHEALHVCLGDVTLCEESGLMAVEYAVMQELHESIYPEWRAEFAAYGLSWQTGPYSTGNVGYDNAFLKSKGWAECVDDAHTRGWLHRGRPVWGMGPNLSKA